MGEIGEGADGIEETEEQTNFFSPLLSPTGKQKTINGRIAPAAVTTPPVVSVSVSIIVSFPRAQRRTALYQSLPISPLPVSLAPRLPSSSSASAAFEECLLELDRRRAIYYQIMPVWIENSVMKAEEARPQRPAEDLLPDPFVTVNEWGFVEEGEEEQDGVTDEESEDVDDQTDDGEESQAFRAHDSLSASAHHLRPIATIHIHHSPASRPRPSPSPQPRRSVSSHSSAFQYAERGNIQRRTPHSPSGSPSSLSSFLTLQHPSIPKAVSHPHLLHYATNSNSPMHRASVSSLGNSPHESIAFDLNAPTYNPPPAMGESSSVRLQHTTDSPTAAVPKTLFYLQPQASLSQSPSHASSHNLAVPTAAASPSSPSPGGLPAVFHGPLMVPSSMSSLRIKQYLSKKLNNSPALTRGVDGEEVTERSLRLVLTDGTELADDQTMGDIAARANSGGSKEKALRVWYRRQTSFTTATPDHAQSNSNGGAAVPSESAEEAATSPAAADGESENRAELEAVSPT